MLSFSAPSPPSRLSSPVLSQIKNERKDNMHSHHRNKPTLKQARVSQRSPSENKASFAADLRSPCRTPFSKNIRQHNVEHHHQTPSISIQHLPQAETEGARSTTINEGPHAATRSTPWDSQLRGLPLAIACRMSSTRKDNICLFTFNAVLVRKRFCHFLDFGLYFFSIFDAVQCFSVSGCSFSYMFRQFLTCVWIFLLSLRRSLHCFLWRRECAHLRRGCFHLRGLVSSCAAVHAAFQPLPSRLCFSFLAL